KDSLYLSQLRGISILRVVLGHLGLTWIFPPYSEFLMALLPLLFFVSGAVSYLSYCNAKSALIFVRKRLVGVLVPFYTISMIALIGSWMAGGVFLLNNSNSVLSWLTVAMPISDMPYPMGQIWFLHSLVIIMIISPIIF